MWPFKKSVPKAEPAEGASQPGQTLRALSFVPPEALPALGGGLPTVAIYGFMEGEGFSAKQFRPNPAASFRLGLRPQWRLLEPILHGQAGYVVEISHIAPGYDEPLGLRGRSYKAISVSDGPSFPLSFRANFSREKSNGWNEVHRRYTRQDQEDE